MERERERDRERARETEKERGKRKNYIENILTLGNLDIKSFSINNTVIQTKYF